MRDLPAVLGSLASNERVLAVTFRGRIVIRRCEFCDVLAVPFADGVYGACRWCDELPTERRSMD